jgi:ubiquitin-protein ligase
MACIQSVDGNLRDVFGVLLGPENTPYEGGIFFTRWFLPEEYPFCPPIVKFLTRIYHPNIDARGRVCIDRLSAQYSPIFYIHSLLLSFTLMLDDPNVDDPLVPEIAQQYQQDREEYNRITRVYTKKYATGDIPELPPIDPNAPWWEGMHVATG